MATKQELRLGVRVTGLLSEQVVTIQSVEDYGSAVSICFRDASGKLAEAILDQSQLAKLVVVVQSNQFFDVDAASDFLLAAEQKRIQYGVQSDPFLAVHGARIEPLPHQISAVYEHMLAQNPLRFLLADDPGAGKTIMAGLLLRELSLRGVVERCLIVPPGSLVEQWQDELKECFGLHFEILTPDALKQHREDVFSRYPLLIARQDMLKNNPAALSGIEKNHWDLIICDEAHRMSANCYGSEVKKTRRYILGELLSRSCRHFLLMTATPHNGKDSEFRLFLSLLDPDRYAGLYRSKDPVILSKNMFRRMMKEELIRFDGTSLFPDRTSTVTCYSLSANELALYDAVTTYVQTEMNRAQRLDEANRVNVTFAMIILQRRLASSTAAVFKSLLNRKQRLEGQLQDFRNQKSAILPIETEVRIEEIDEEISAEEWEDWTEISSSITAAQTMEELQKEIQTVDRLLELTRQLRASGLDAKWSQLQTLLASEAFAQNGVRRKLLIFSEFRDTLAFLQQELTGLFGKSDAVVTVHGGVEREERLRLLQEFRYNPSVFVLLANDAVGEGVNLQQCHLMINYDLPWNPNRLEQRFGRIHRIGQQKPCHQWNLIAHETREGQVFQRMLEKLEAAREQLDGKVFDVLGQVFEDHSLRDMILAAISAGEDLQKRNQVFRKLDDLMDTERIREALKKKAFDSERLDMSQLLDLREQMERASVQRLQPHNLRDFFLRALNKLEIRYRVSVDSTIYIPRLPAALQDFSRERLPAAWEKITFDRDDARKNPDLTLLSPGHALFEAISAKVFSLTRTALESGTILAMDECSEAEPFLVYGLEMVLGDGSGTKPCYSELRWLTLKPDLKPCPVGTGVLLDCRPLTDSEKAVKNLDLSWAYSPTLAKQAVQSALQLFLPGLQERLEQRQQRLEEQIFEVSTRLKAEILHLTNRAESYRDLAEKGQSNFFGLEKNTRQEIERLQVRRQQRLTDLQAQKDLRILAPRVIATALVIPSELLQGEANAQAVQATYEQRRRIELLAMAAVLDFERALGHTPKDVSAHNLGYDIESKAKTGELRFIEVKGHSPTRTEIHLTRNEALKAKNSPENWILALCQVDQDFVSTPAYIQGFDFGEPGDFGRQIQLSTSELYSKAKVKPNGIRS